MKIKISEIIALAEREREINKPDIRDIEFLDDEGNKIEIDPEIIEDFAFIGLNNVDFVTSGFYLTGWDKTETRDGIQGDKQ